MRPEPDTSGADAAVTEASTDGVGHHIGHETLQRISGNERTNRWLFEVLEPHLGRRILEAGSGIGNLSRFLLDRERVVCVDLDDIHIETLERRFGDEPNVRVARADLADGDLLRVGQEEEPDTVYVPIVW